MGRGQMRNLETFKVGSGQVNEFEYQKNQGQLTEQLDQHPDEPAKEKKEPTQAERVKQITATAHKKVEKRRKKESAKLGPLKRKTAAKKTGSKTTTSAKAKKSIKPKMATKPAVSTKSGKRSGPSVKQRSKK